ncbi:MAG: hypothetical protein L3K17_07270 [Thermoplasmata archaeon]|nr:hypothetical protein [Thermoplasmata archaeon]
MKGAEAHDFYLAQGCCDGRITGTFHGSNPPRRPTDETYAMDLQGEIETLEQVQIMLDYQGYGRSRARSDELYDAAGVASPATKFRRQVVGFARHVTDSPAYRWLNDAVCAISGEVRVPVGPAALPWRRPRSSWCSTSRS